MLFLYDFCLSLFRSADKWIWRKYRNVRHVNKYRIWCLCVCVCESTQSGKMCASSIKIRSEINKNHQGNTIFVSASFWSSFEFEFIQCILSIYLDFVWVKFMHNNPSIDPIHCISVREIFVWGVWENVRAWWQVTTGNTYFYVYFLRVVEKFICFLHLQSKCLK